MSEKIAAMIEEIKGLTVLELSELVHALEDTFGVSAVLRRSRSSRKSAASPVWAWLRPRPWSKAFPPRSRKASPRKTPRPSRLSSRLSALPSSSSNLFEFKRTKNSVSPEAEFFVISTPLLLKRHYLRNAPHHLSFLSCEKRKTVPRPVPERKDRQTRARFSQTEHSSRG